MYVDLNILIVLGSNLYLKKNKIKCEFKILLVLLVFFVDIY